MAVPVMRWIGERIEEVSHHIGDDAYMETTIEQQASAPQAEVHKKVRAARTVGPASFIVLKALNDAKATLVANYQRDLAELDAAIKQHS